MQEGASMLSLSTLRQRKLFEWATLIRMLKVCFSYNSTIYITIENQYGHLIERVNCACCICRQQQFGDISRVAK